jgi:hypothetical protein
MAGAGPAGAPIAAALLDRKRSHLHALHRSNTAGVLHPAAPHQAAAAAAAAAGGGGPPPPSAHPSLRFSKSAAQIRRAAAPGAGATPSHAAGSSALLLARTYSVGAGLSMRGAPGGGGGGGGARSPRTSSGAGGSEGDASLRGGAPCCSDASDATDREGHRSGSEDGEEALDE